MTQKLSHIFKEMSEVNPPEELGSLILQKISLKKARREKIKFYISYSALLASLGTFFGSILSYGAKLLNSEFASLLKLIFSDARIISGYWQDFLYSLLETIPVFYILAILIPIFAMLVSYNFFLHFKNRIKVTHNLFKYI